MRVGSEWFFASQLQIHVGWQYEAKRVAADCHEPGAGVHEIGCTAGFKAILPGGGGLLEVVIVHNIKPEQQNELWYRDARGFLKEMEDSSEHPPNFSIKAMLHIREEGDTLGDLRNRGVEQCSSEFVMVWDDDDLQLARV